jgi:hypothetical protein
MCVKLATKSKRKEKDPGSNMTHIAIHPGMTLVRLVEADFADASHAGIGFSIPKKPHTN